MEIKDLAGLSEPLTKLIEVTSKGIGHIAMPYQIKRIADAKVYEIEKISKAIEANKESMKMLEYDDEKVKVICNQKEISQEASQEHAALSQRASNRLLTREIKRQINIENTIYAAAEDLSQVEKVSDESVDEDWVNRYFNTIEDVSNEQMQNLWGRILSGEIKKPKTYSLRTLDTLRNISSKEAEMFCKVGELALTSNDNAFIPQHDNFLKNELKVEFTDLMLLRDLGLLFPNDLEFSFGAGNKDQLSLLINGKTVIILNRDAETPKIPLAAVFFTQTGKELLNLVDQPFNKKYVEYVGKKFKKNKNIRASYAFLRSIKDNLVQYSNPIEI